MLKKFMKEENGSMLVEFIIVAAFIAITAATLGPYVKPFFHDVSESLTNPFERRKEESTSSKNEFTKGLSEPIITISQSNNITSKTPLTFSASVFNGQSPYHFSWSGYNGQSDGSEGLPETFLPGTHTVSVTVTDAKGDSKSKSITFTVKDIEAAILLSKDAIHVGESLNVNVSGQNLQCQILSPISSDGCFSSLTFQEHGTKNIEIEICQDGKCEIHTATVEVSYPSISANIAANRSFPITDKDFISFKANVNGGSGQYNVTWENVVGPESANVFGKELNFTSGIQTVKLRVCDAVQTELCDSDQISFEVKKTFVAEPLETMIIGSFPGNKTLDGSNVGFKVVATGGSAPYTVKWLTGYTGSTQTEVFGDVAPFYVGKHTVSAETCDANNTCKISNFEFETIPN